jgi:hypothetical protein
MRPEGRIHLMDEMPVSELRAYLREHWPRIKEELLEGGYQPAPIKKVEILKAGGSVMRQLGIPMVLDRLIQLTLHQVLQPVFEKLDKLIRRRLHCILWRQWKRNYTRARNLMNLMKLGFTEERAWMSATNGYGPLWNAGASHMNQALPKKYFDAKGLTALLDQHRRFQGLTRTAVYENRMCGGVRGRGGRPLLLLDFWPMLA